MRKKINDSWDFFCDNQWHKIDLPHDWVIGRPFSKDAPHAAAQGYRDRFSSGKYKKILHIDKVEAGRKYFLHFDGVFENCSVFVNDTFIGGKKYGYTPFDLEISNNIFEGENEIRVDVDNTVQPADRWYSGCGIYRDVYLVDVPEKYIDRNNVCINFKNDTLVINTDIEENILAEIFVEDVLYTAQGKNQLEIKIGEHRKWSAEEPVLYTLKLTLEENGFCEEFIIGLRTIDISEKGMFVNGEMVKLKGVCIHQDVAMFGTAVPTEIWRDRLLKLKEYGCNALRPSHHIFSPGFMDLCDELGFYVYEECFDKWVSGLYLRYYDTEWESDMTAMIKRDRNRPSVIMWGMGNEVEYQGHEEMLERLKNHCNLARKLDSTRPTCYAMNPHFKRKQNVDLKKVKDIQVFVDEVDKYEIFDPAEKLDMIKGIAEIVDVIGCNYQEVWYEKIHEMIPNKPILGTETHQFKTDYNNELGVYPEENPWIYAQENSYVLGGMIWTGIDYLGESTIWPAKGWSGSLFYSDMIPRASAYILRSFWSEKPFVKFFVMDYSVADEGVKENWDIPRYVSHWHFPHIYRTLVPIMVTSNCTEISVEINKKIVLRAKPSNYINNMVTAFIPYTKGNL